MRNIEDTKKKKKKKSPKLPVINRYLRQQLRDGREIIVFTPPYRSILLYTCLVIGKVSSFFFSFFA